MRNVVNLTFPSALTEESFPRGKPTGGQAKDCGESERLIVMIKIAVAINTIYQDHGASNRADFRMVFQYESL
jgi:hypothetical protein